MKQVGVDVIETGDPSEAPSDGFALKKHERDARREFEKNTGLLLVPGYYFLVIGSFGLVGILSSFVYDSMSEDSYSLAAFAGISLVFGALLIRKSRMGLLSLTLMIALLLFSGLTSFSFKSGSGASTMGSMGDWLFTLLWFGFIGFLTLVAKRAFRAWPNLKWI